MSTFFFLFCLSFCKRVLNDGSQPAWDAGRVGSTKEL